MILSPVRSLPDQKQEVEVGKSPHQRTGHYLIIHHRIYGCGSGKGLEGIFYVFGEIKSVAVTRKSNCALINFATRAGAELAF
ncbi:MAG: hypothetical protein JOS17DRAFT_787802 [Linnemannia elongata]|nr:MAG: hypothetical protein JOS17DRAFT_787802 [Linnemannia elongata]